MPEEPKADWRGGGGGEGCDEVMGSIKLRRGLRYYLIDVSALALTAGRILSALSSHVTGIYLHL